MAPFAEVSDRLGRRVRELDGQQGAFLFVCIGQALRPAFVRWSRETDGPVREVELLDRAIARSTDFALASSRWSLCSRRSARALGHEMSREAPGSDETTIREDHDDFVAAQDCWICVDVALGVAGGRPLGTGSIWYALEPQFQATCERLFGFTDPGSEGEDHDESLALEDTELAAAIAGLDEALSDLTTRSARRPADVMRTVEALAVLQP